ncbi:hypothetical protein EFP00_10750 [Lactiplantibacillus paraplantarum]|uniref:Uncharacterized protein n=1 Tax=Lactiplantibacillus paraplantarum TaxID=60520 RepID=A0A4Q9Y476_9LACO|nr:hypothetical protein [Lactiplantibacillus paraplantarum]MCT4457877.1 hypothetical protein [Lactiplantibacillus paraplantarum]TBX46023.1 hypothetical protein EUZ87_05615 [Lactiplantibacillus paraplantarum]
MLLGMTIYSSLKLGMRLIIYIILGGLVLFIRHRNRKKSRREMDEETKKLMARTKKDENGKYPWEN